MAKAIQIATVVYQQPSGSGEVVELYALDDAGNIFRIVRTRDGKGFGEWVKLKPLPTTRA